MELVRCPACGCSVQVAEGLLGRQVRCFGCQQAFVATPDRPPPPPWRETPPAPPERPRPAGEDDWLGEEARRPFCPGCGRRISWEVLRCPFCGEEFEAEEERQRWQRRTAAIVRRDYEPHRGRLIQGLGNVSLLVGGLSVCLLGAGALVSLPLGITAWMMANRDLERMRQGRMDPQGKAPTEIGRTGGIAGCILSLIFAAFYAAVYFLT